MRDFLNAPTINRIFLRSINISSQEITNIHSRDFDIHLLPPVGEFDIFAFDKIDTLIQRGREATCEALPEIQEKLKALCALCAQPPPS